MSASPAAIFVLLAAFLACATADSLQERVDAALAAAGINASVAIRESIAAQAARQAGHAPAPRYECARECACSRGGLNSYGRYCGYEYTGCAGFVPCDALDACCMVHDDCCGARGLKDCECSRELAYCSARAYYAVVRGMSSATAAWECKHAAIAAARTLSDILVLTPECFGDAERVLLQSAIDFCCGARENACPDPFRSFLAAHDNKYK